MGKKRPDCIAFVYGDQRQKLMLQALADQAGMSVSAYVVWAAAKRYAELYGDLDPTVLAQPPVS